MRIIPSILGLLFFLSQSLFAEASASPFTADFEASKQSFHQFCDFVAAEKINPKSIFIGGYYMRSLVAGWQIFHEQRYLDAAIAYADSLLARQSPRGYWATGYGDIFLADTGSALGLFIVLNKHVSPERQQRYREAIGRYVGAIEKDGLINPSGAFGVGYKTGPGGEILEPIMEEYTISSGLSGGEIFTWYGAQSVEPRRNETAYRALKWAVSTMREDGMIPYILPLVGGDRAKMGTPKADAVLWGDMCYQVTTYLGEGVIAFDRHSKWPSWKQELRLAIRPHIEFLLRTQNPDGTWAKKDSWDQKRSPGVANLLMWYYSNVEKQERIAAAVRKFNSVLVDPALAKEFGMLNRGAVTKWATPAGKIANFVPNDILTALSGRALAEMISPGIDSDW